MGSHQIAPPAAHAYRDLVYNQWWTKWAGQTDAQGKCQLRAFHGKHRVTVGGAEKVVELKSAAGAASVEF